MTYAELEVSDLPTLQMSRWKKIARITRILGSSLKRIAKVLESLLRKNKNLTRKKEKLRNV